MLDGPLLLTANRFVEDRIEPHKNPTHVLIHAPELIETPEPLPPAVSNPRVLLIFSKVGAVFAIGFRENSRRPRAQNKGSNLLDEPIISTQ